MKDNILIVNAVAMQISVIGDYLYRVEQPSIAMGKIPGVTVVTVTTISPYFEAICLQADVLILHLLTEHDLLPIIEERKRRGFATVYEISDNFAVDQPGVGIRGWFRDPLNRAQAFQLITMADAVQVTGEGLLGKYRFLNNNMVIFENQICEIGQMRPKETCSLVIGWGGSSGHAEDLRQIAQTIAGICNRHPHVIFSFMGDREQYDEIFSSIKESQKSYTAPGTLHDYYHFLETLDIGIATMLDTSYNQCRSDIKFIEYASRGVVPVLSSITPYKKHAVHGTNAFLFEDDKTLGEILEDLLLKPHLREKIAHNALTYVEGQRMEDLNASNRITFYKGICKKRAVTDFKAFTLVRLCEGSEAYDVEKTEAEILLCNGVAEEANGNVNSARSLYQDSHEVMSDYYLPLFWLGYSYMRHHEDEKAIKFFEHTIGKNPRSVRSLLYLGKILESREKEKSLNRYESALSVSPSYAPSLDAIAHLYEKSRDYSNAAKFYNRTLEVNPFYGNAALGLGRVYQLLGEMEKAQMAFQIAADLGSS